MSWWSRILRRTTRSPLKGLEYRVAFTLHSKDGMRAVEVREFSNGETYLVEKEQTQGSDYADRHSGKLVGPFASIEEAEKFVITTPWFLGRTGRGA